MIAIVPLLVERIVAIESERAEGVEAAAKHALNLAKQGMAAQNEVFASARAFLEVASSAQAMMTTRGDRCDHFLEDAVKKIPWLTAISVATLSGQTFCSSNANFLGVDVSKLPHFVQAVRTGNFALSDYFVSPWLGPTLLSALPHRTPEGAIDAVVIAPLELSWFSRVAHALADANNSVVLMLDGSGTLLARQPSRENWVGREYKEHPMVRAMLASSEGYYIGECLDGVRRIFGFVQLPGTNARLAVGLDEKDVLAGANLKILKAFAILAAITAIVLLGIWFGGEQLFMGPIHQLTRTAQRFGRGELRMRANRIPLVAEFLPLAAALDDMASRLASRERDLHESNRKLQELAHIDGLTGIANRRTFNERLASEWQQANELQRPIAVLMIDVDHFKLFNDKYGHIEGDACLQRLGEILSVGTRSSVLNDTPAPHAARQYPDCNSDLAARYGGEEFAILLPGADIDDAIKIASRLQKAIEKLQIVSASASGGLVTISVGVASMVPTKAQNAEWLVQAADTALYEAKHKGRNTVVAFSSFEFARAS